MPPITRASRKRREGIERRRCGACLFELPGHLMPKSSDLPYSEDFVPNLTAVGHGAHRVKKIDFISSAKRGCNVCSLINDFSIKDFPNQFPDDVILWVRGGIDFMSERSALQVFMHDHASSSAYPLSVQPFVDRGSYPSGDTKSPEAFKKALSWIERCRHQHQTCKKVSQGKRMPKRIIFIEDFESWKVRLIENADELLHQPYVCLSHRWMPETKASSLTRERAETFKKRIPKEIIYPLLADAVEATQRLGFQYLWIDCLCIYQDSLQDWHQQASDMSTIYENAAITLSALSSGPESNTKRLFSQKAPLETSELALPDGSKVFFRYLEEKSHPFQINKWNMTSVTDPCHEFPLTGRGWAYQERLLSTRILHFTREELIWECKEALWCECRFQEGLWTNVQSSTSALLDMSWEAMIFEYTKKDLSIESDRLPALSGIAKRFGEARGWTYLAGLWQERLEDELVWVVDSPKTRPKPRQLPSWSWASVKGSQFFIEMGNSLIQLISQDIGLGPNPFGVPKSAKLVLQGPCLPATLLYGHDMKIAFNGMLPPGISEYDNIALKVEDMCLKVFCDYKFTELGQDHLPSGTEVVFMVSSLGYRCENLMGLVLLSVDPLESTYERVGIIWDWRLQDESINKYKKLQEAWKTRRIIFL